MRMFQHLLKVRYLAVVIVILAILHALGFLLMGTLTAMKGYTHLWQYASGGDTVRPGLELLHSLDYLFVSLVLIILALGIAKLFLLNPDGNALPGLPSWLHVENISELKVLLWETILTTLLILGLSDLTSGILEKPDYTVLITPTAILILAISLYFMKRP
jgi:uncharacterized membrane protein YqhA